MSKPQISTRVSERTKQQSNWLRRHYAYSLRDVVTVAIDRFYQQMKKEKPMTRFLTDSEIAACPTDSSVNVAIQGADGTWFYGDGNPTADDPSGLTDAQFVVDDDNDYIPISHR